MKGGSPSYTFNTADAYNVKKGGGHRRRGSDDADPTDGNGSLTYSAASSVQSGGSAAGESTDSSFADIMRVLDLQDSRELQDFLKKEGVSSPGELRQKRGFSGTSVTSSLQYSIDGESLLEGTKMLQTIAGQPSDSYAFDGGSGFVKNSEDPITDSDIMFTPAEPCQVSKKKRNKDKMDKKDRSGGTRSTASTTSSTSRTPQSKNPPRSYEYSPSLSFDNDTPTKSPPDSKTSPGTPPPHPRKDGVECENEDDVWYAKWWMHCFPDFNNLMPKR